MIFWASDLRIQFSLCVDKLDSETLANIKDFKGHGKRTCIVYLHILKSKVFHMYIYWYNVHICFHSFPQNWIFYSI